MRIIQYNTTNENEKNRDITCTRLSVISTYELAQARLLIDLFRTIPVYQYYYFCHYFLLEQKLESVGRTYTTFCGLTR